MFGNAPRWVDDGVREYQKRLSNLHVERVNRNPVKTRVKRMHAMCPNNSQRVYLDKSGNAFTSESLARQCATWERGGRDVCFLIGDDVGFSSADLKQADLVWSLSDLTFPHQLTRVLVCEQLYRAHSINAGHAYHRS